MLPRDDLSNTTADGFVAENGNGRFTALVVHDGGGPFCFTDGPAEASLDDALAWVRARAARVVVRVDDSRFSAGEHPIAGLPELDVVEPAAPAAPELPGEPALWQVTAGTTWHGPDALEVRAALALALARDRRILDEAVAVLDGGALRIAFATLAPSRLDAGETASLVLRRAWLAVGVDAVAGEHFDASFIDVTPA